MLLYAKHTIILVGLMRSNYPGLLHVMLSNLSHTRLCTAQNIPLLHMVSALKERMTICRPSTTGHWCFRPRFCTAGLYWAGANLDWWQRGRMTMAGYSDIQVQHSGLASEPPAHFCCTRLHTMTGEQMTSRQADRKDIWLFSWHKTRHDIW